MLGEEVAVRFRTTSGHRRVYCIALHTLSGLRPRRGRQLRTPSSWPPWTTLWSIGVVSNLGGFSRNGRGSQCIILGASVWAACKFGLPNWDCHLMRNSSEFGPALLFVSADRSRR